MNLIISILVAFITIQHIGFLIIEMFFWTKPLGQKIFNLTPEFSKESAYMAANQGLYNGFLAAGLIWALTIAPADQSFSLKIFFVSCVLVAGIYGAYSVSKKILFVQAAPAALTLALLLI